MGKLFGTDGVRGVANKELTAEMAFQFGRAGAYVLTNEMKHAPQILVGMDTRISGDMLESALVAGICSVGATAVPVGVMPTPGIAYLVRSQNLDAGVVISASHNPMEYNGIKFFSNTGYKLSDELEERIETYILEKYDEIPWPLGENIGRKALMPDALQRYVDFLASTINVSLDGKKIAVDCANGAAYEAAPAVLKKLGATVDVFFNKPDGVNINCNCGSTHLEALSDIVKNGAYDIGFAFDGDADRLLCVDENGQIVDGDQTMAIISLDLKEKGLLKSNTLVATVMSNLGLFLMAEKNDIHVEQTAVGDRYVLERMLEKGYIIGGEQSGHIIFLEHNTTGDGILTALQLLNVLVTKGKKLSELASVMQVLPQVIVNAKVDNARKQDYLKNDTIKNAIDALSEQFAGEGRVLIRPSGTEPLVRVMIEGKDPVQLETEAKRIASLIEEELK